MVESNKKVLITTSGLGSRLGDLTEYTNKSLVRIGKKPTISYIIDSYPTAKDFVITLGHYGKQVKDFLELAYPDKNFEFVRVDKYQGEGSSLGYSLLQAKEHLQCPFVFHACDTIIQEPIPITGDNWLGVCKLNKSNHYRSITVDGDYVERLNEKDELNYDYDYVGVASIENYSFFWDVLSTLVEEGKYGSSLSDCHVISRMSQKFKYKVFNSWLDVGNSDSLRRARETISDKFHILDKVDESIFLFEDKVIKFFSSPVMIENRVTRASLLKGVVPEIVDRKENFYSYGFIKGDVLSEVVNPVMFENLLTWSSDNLWSRINSDEDIKELSYSFYYTKTVERVSQFISDSKIQDQEEVINGKIVLGAYDLIDSIPRELLQSDENCLFHGDFILDNIIKTGEGFKLIDWRQDYAGKVFAGDIYYDLAKLNHSLSVNHDIVNADLYTVKKNDDGSFVVDINKRAIFEECQDKLFRFVRSKGYSEKKIRILTALIWLNMSPLHHHPFNKFLYYFGRYKLQGELDGA